MMKSIIKSLLLLLSLMATFVAHADYTLGTGDYVRITVYGDQELTREIRIAENGVLSFPLIGEIKVDGLTTVEAEKLIADKLKAGGIINNPFVSVVVSQFMSKTVTVLGGVLKPGRFPVTRPSDVRDMIAEAGGLTGEGSEMITLVKGQQRFDFDLRAIINGEVDAANIVVNGGETVYVNTRDVTVAGQLLRPGKYTIQGSMRRLTDFVSMAGGVTENADEFLYYTTQSAGQETTEKINIDALFKSPTSTNNKLINPGDVIYIPKAAQVYVYGEVQRPGMYKIDKNMTVMQAIAKAGGLTIRGTQKSAKLHRKTEHATINKKAVDLFTILQDDDVLYIEESLL